MRQNYAQIGKIMSTELKSHQYKQQMTFSDGEINLNSASLFSNVFFFYWVLFIHSTTNNIEQREHDHNGAEEKQN